MAGILNALGSETNMLIRNDKVLRSFDEMISENVTEKLASDGINLEKYTNVSLNIFVWDSNYNIKSSLKSCYMYKYAVQLFNGHSILCLKLFLIT